MGNKDQVYSIDGSYYMNWESLMDELRDYHDDGESAEVWEADKVECKHADFIDVDHFIWTMQDAAADGFNDLSDGYLSELSDTQKIELKNHIADWFAQSGVIKFHGVENEHKIVVIVE